MNHFFALTLPDDVRPFLARTISEWHRSLPPDVSARWYAPEDCHITLKFLGDLPPSRQVSLIEAAAPVAAATEPFPLTLAPCGGFPDLRRPFVLWAGVTPSPTLTRLAGELDRAMTGQGFAPERRPYVAHITLARCRAGRRREPLSAPDESEQTFPAFQVAGFALMQTLPPEAHPNGSKRRYNTVQTFPFHSTHSSAPEI